MSLAPSETMNWLRGRKRQPESITVQANDVTITISGEALQALFELASRENLTLSEVLARAIAVDKAVSDANAEGRKVFIEPKGDRPSELVSA